MGKERLWAVGSSSAEDELELGPAIVGTCPDMCSAHERAMRERLHDLSPFEQAEPGKGHRTSPSLAVKKFCRTQRDVQASEVRPLAVLRRTLDHLLSVLPPHTPGLPSAYPFLCDRFRAIRQEMVMQGIGGQDARDLLLPMIRFHILAAAVIPAELASADSPTGTPEHSSSMQGQPQRGPSPRSSGSDARQLGASPLSSSVSTTRRTTNPAQHQSGFDAHLNLKFLGQCLLFALECFPAAHRKVAQGAQGQAEAEAEAEAAAPISAQQHRIRRCNVAQAPVQACVKDPQRASEEGAEGNTGHTAAHAHQPQAAVPQGGTVQAVEGTAAELAHSFVGLDLESRFPAGVAPGEAPSHPISESGVPRGFRPASAPVAGVPSGVPGSSREDADALSPGDGCGQCAEAEVWSYYVLLHLGPLPAQPTVDSMAVVLSAIPRRVFACRVFQVALRALQCYRSGNYVGYYRVAAAPSSAASPWQLCLLHLHAPQVLRQCLLATHASGISQYPVPLAYLGCTMFLDKAALASVCREEGFLLRGEGSGKDPELIPKAERAKVEGVPAVFLPLPSKLVHNLECSYLKGLLGTASTLPDCHF